ncbi:MAG: RdgB/HAM1 family non-canonical purine NTP pyrophosphatase [Actinomycetia bacterium]|nr:RdgB/HAM1 family non-canonical purine NTP pyrophosphatase [Actinomycetes bacterium]
MSAGEARRVIVASTNHGKLAEIRSALDLDGWEFVTATDLGRETLDVEETGATFAENALLKARAYAEAFGLAALADDSGLEVDALAGAPGVRSARYSGEGATDARNNKKLLDALTGLPEAARSARFRSAVALVEPDGAVTAAEGTCEGRIGLRPAGTGGFGYDPLFLPAAAPGRTMAELSLAEKNAISHRGEALRALRQALTAAGRG